jgi:hypothetical protein
MNETDSTIWISLPFADGGGANGIWTLSLV